MVENARLYSVPDTLPALMVAAAGPRSSELAARFGGGLIATEPDAELIDRFRSSGGHNKPCYGELHVCFDQDERRAQEIAHEVWPVIGLAGQLYSELPSPSLFEKAAKLVTREKIASRVPCGPDPNVHLRAIQEYVAAGFDHISIHQIGRNQEAFMDFYAEEIVPKIFTKPVLHVA